MATRHDQAEPRPAQEPQTAQKSPPPLDRNTALLLYDELTTPKGLRRFYDYHAFPYNDDKHEYFAHECTLLAAEITFELAFLLRLPGGDFIAQRIAAGHQVYVDFYPMPKDQAREEYHCWPIRLVSAAEAFGAAAPAK